MRNYDIELSDAKRAVTAALCRAVSSGELDDLASCVDTLNATWDALTDALVRQREERDRQIRHLIDELAEARGR